MPFSELFLLFGLKDIYVRKLAMSKINLIIRVSMYRNNDLLAVNTNNTSIIQIEIRSQKATQIRQIDNGSIHEINIVS
jgi:hypothetical protein